MRKDFGAKAFLYPMPVLIIATYNADGTANESFVATIALNALTPLIELEEKTDSYSVDLYKAIQGQIFDRETLDKLVQETLFGILEEGEDETGKYFVDNKQIVVVSYGDRELVNGTYVKTVTKTFILNYNNFAVRVEYDGSTYTIPRGGYIVLDYDQTNGG